MKNTGHESNINKGDEPVSIDKGFLHIVLESLNHPFYVIDANDYTIKLANSAANFGKLHTTDTCYSLTHGRDRPCVDNEHPCVLEKIKQIRKPVIVEHVHFDDRGNPRIFEVHGYPIFDNDGNVVQIIEYNLDITRRKKAEESLEKAHRLMETIFENTHIMIAYLDPDFNFIRVNTAYAAADEREPSFFPGKNHFDIYPNEENEEIFRSVVESGEPHFEFAKPFEYAEFPERGVSYWDWSLTPIKDAHGTVTGLILTLQNVTERREAVKKVEESLREKELLLKEVHHRVKNNLSVIHSLLELQSGYIKDDRYREMFNDSMTRIRTMALIHERLYRSEKLSEIIFSEYIDDMLDSMCKSYGPASRKVRLVKDIEKVNLSVDDAIPCGLIINELVSNSLKHAFPENREGEIRVSIRTRNSGDIEMTVSDNGIGIPANLDIKNTDSLGLTVVYALTGQLRGKLDLDRENGTEFRISFPVRDQ